MHDMSAIAPRRLVAALALATTLGACSDPSGPPFERGTRILFMGPVACPPDRTNLACSGLYSVDPDGGAPVRVDAVHDVAGDQGAWTLDGTRVAFPGYDASHDWYITRALTIGSQDTLTVAAPSWPYQDLVWSPDGSRLAYHHRDQLCVGPAPGPSERCYGAFGDRFYRAIGFTPDGASLVARSDTFMTSGGARYEGIFLLDIATANRTKLPIAAQHIFSAATSPAAPQLAYETDVPVRVAGGDDRLTLRLFVVSMAGGAPRRLTALSDVGERSGETRPRWSPDGRRIAFALGQAVLNVGPVTWLESADLYVVNSDGSDLRRLTSTGGAYPVAWVR